MCGIAGFYGGVDKKSNSIITHMLTRIKHRGPDQSGIYTSNNVVLGSVRLSIIDLEGGTMPISSQNELFWIVFNGEIFNYIELKEELVKKGYSFRTDSDTEVIVNLYQEYGKEFISKLNGQFAIAIWDKNKEELFLTRDRVGIRPLFYTQTENSFVFGSEIKALIEHPDVSLKLAPKALSQYFTFWTALSPATAFKDVYEVPPGTYLIVNENKIEHFTYWKLPINKPNAYKYNTLEEASVKFEETFSEAIKIRLRSDVPVAAYLSGGIDSSITTSFVKKICPGNLKTYSIGFDEKEFDESSYQRIASDYFNTDHQSVCCNSSEIADNFEKVVWYCEAPLLRTAPIPMSLLAKSVRDDNTKVVITGEGADELLGGYNIFKETKIRHFWAKNPNSKFRAILLKRLYPYLPQMKEINTNILKMFFGFKLNETKSPIYSHLLRWNNTSRIINYLSNDVKKVIGNYEPIEDIEDILSNELKGYDYLTKAQFIEIKLFMSGYLLSSQGDRMAMANSIESRYPFLDHRMIEFCMSVHPDLKLRILNEKYLLKKTMIGKLPEEILERSKQAYRAPIKSVFLSEEIPMHLKKMLSEKKIREFGIFNFDKVNLLFNKMKNKNQFSEIDNMALITILSTQILYDQFVNKNIPGLREDDLIKLNKVITN